jgi:predicted anti-sigma-YlaC factor YlaD
MNGHAEMRKLLAVYDSLDAAARRAVDAHVKICPGCMAQQKAYAEMDARLVRLVDPQAPATLAAGLDGILRGERPQPRSHADVRERRWSARRMWMPAGLLLLLILGVWLVMRVSTPVDHSVAQTPSVTPTATPVASASPQGQGAAVTAESLSWLATRQPVPSVSVAGSHPRMTSPAVHAVAPLAAAMFQASAPPLPGTVVAQQ